MSLTIKIEPNHIYFQATEAQAKQLDAIWVKARNAWKVPNTLGALRELHKLGYDVIEYGKRKAKLNNLYKELKTNPSEIQRYEANLRPYQNNDIYYLTRLPHAAIFNEQRTGKHL